MLLYQHNKKSLYDVGTTYDDIATYIALATNVDVATCLIYQHMTLDHHVDLSLVGGCNFEYEIMRHSAKAASLIFEIEVRRFANYGLSRKRDSPILDLNIFPPNRRL